MSVRFSLPRLPEFAAKDPATYETFKALERAVNRILANTNVRVDETETVLGDLSDESYVVITVTADVPNARSITSDSTITITDGGAGSTLTLVRAALTGDGTTSGNAFTISNDAVTTAKILDANVTRAKLSNSVANSVIGRAANSAGVPADIAASVDGDTLRQSGTTTGFSQPTALVEVTLADGANDDIAITGTETVRIVRIVGPTLPFSVSGFTAPAAGRVIVLHNTTAQAMTIVNDATSTAANRILTLALAGANIVLPARNSSATLAYDSTAARWIVASYN